MTETRRPRLSSLVTAGCVLLIVGLFIGRSSGPGSAHAQRFNDQRATDRFGIAVPSGGFGIVKAPNGLAFVVDSAGRARRILFSTSVGADDQPRPAATEWLILY